MLDRTVELGMDAVAITDHGTLSGAIEFYQEAIKRNLKPVIGVEAYVAPRGLEDKSAKVDANPHHLVLLATNLEGYRNLMELVTIANLEGFYYKPRVDRDLLSKYHKGLIALSGCANGEVPRHILNHNFDQAEETAKWYQSTFGSENYYLELQDHEEWETQKQINAGLLKLHKKTGIPMVVTSDSHYCLPSDRQAHEILLCVQTGKTIGDTDRMEMEMDLFISDPKDIAKRWQKNPEALNNTAKIANRCNLTIEFNKLLLPVFDVPTKENQADYLRRLSFQGLAWRYGGIPKEDILHITEQKAKKLVQAEIIERLEYELKVISDMGYPSYFLIVADFVNWGKNQGIIFGPGRGSAAGSLLSYVLNITDIDPLKYNLLFERFLNPDRISMPDIDIDIQDNRRGEVIDYVTEKYGQDKVAQIITFGTMAARNAVRDTGRALGMAYLDVDRIAKMIPPPFQGHNILLAKSIQNNPELKQEYGTNPQSKRLIDLAIRLEGTIRNNGIHAAGVVIAPEPLVNFTPLQRAQKGGIATQYSMNPIEELGLLKMDFLGLSNLTTIKNALRIIRKVYNVQLDLAQIPIDDKPTYDLLTRGDTTGVFQLESPGMKRYIKELKPTLFEDIIAMVALYRPGPMQWIDDFISRKNGHKKIEYLHPIMEKTLASTYGIMVYQEQVIQITKDLCGFTGGQADTLRKAIGKKQVSTMAKLKKDFIEGAIKTSGVGLDTVEELWIQLQEFAAYCFNKSHSAGYAMIAYQTAYLKTHYPAAFMAALMTSDADNIERIAIEVAECRRMDIEVLPPSANESFLEFGVMPDTGQIRFGLGAIKNLGAAPIEAIIEAREKGGKFISIEDFARRVNASEINRKAWESLIKSGALDDLEERGKILHNLDLILNYANKYQKNALSAQIDIFGSLGVEEGAPKIYLEEPNAQLTNQEYLAGEKEHLGLYLSNHPLDDFENYLAKHTLPVDKLKGKSEGEPIKIGGILTSVKKIITRNNTVMAFVTLEDKTGQVELIVFPRIFEELKNLWEVDKILEVVGKVSLKTRDGQIGEEIKVIADKAAIIDPEIARTYQKEKAPVDNLLDPEVEEPDTCPRLLINLSDLTDSTKLLALKELLGEHKGECEAFVLLAGSSPKKIRLPFKVDTSKELLKRLFKLLGKNQVHIET